MSHTQLLVIIKGLSIKNVTSKVNYKLRENYNGLKKVFKTIFIKGV